MSYDDSSNNNNNGTTREFIIQSEEVKITHWLIKLIILENLCTHESIDDDETWTEEKWEIEFQIYCSSKSAVAMKQTQKQQIYIISWAQLQLLLMTTRVLCLALQAADAISISCFICRSVVVCAPWLKKWGKWCAHCALCALFVPHPIKKNIAVIVVGEGAHRVLISIVSLAILIVASKLYYIMEQMRIS